MVHSRESKRGCAGDRQDDTNAHPHECLRRRVERACDGVGCTQAREEVEPGKKDETEGPEAHAKVVHAGIVETAQEVRHAEQLKENGDTAGDRERISDLCGLVGEG